MCLFCIYFVYLCNASRICSLMSFVKFEKYCHYLLKYFIYPMCFLLSLSLSLTPIICILDLFYYVLHMSSTLLYNPSFLFFVFGQNTFYWSIFQFINPFFRYVHFSDLLLDHLSFSWLSLWQILKHFTCWIRCSSTTWIFVENMVLVLTKVKLNDSILLSLAILRSAEVDII